MYTTTILLATGLTTSCLALPQSNNGGSNGPPPTSFNDAPFSGRHEWIPASKIQGSTRSPCPFLNTAANHAYLPRDGRRISKAQFDRAQIDALNFSPDFASALSTGMLSKLNLPLETTLFNLDQLDAHGITEHDVSITRLDKNQGNNIIVNPPLVSRFLEDSFLPWLNTTSVARTRNRRTRESRRAGNGPLDQGGLAAAQGEAALVLLTMSDEIGTVNAGNADALRCPKARVQRWLLDERFPVLDGFRIPRRQIVASENAAIVQRLTFWEGQDQNGRGNGGADRGDGGTGVGGMGDGGHSGGYIGGNNGGREGGFTGGNNEGRPGLNGGNNGGRPGGFNGGNNGGFNGGINGAGPSGFTGGINGGGPSGYSGGINGGAPSGFNGGNNGGGLGGFAGGNNGGLNGGFNGGFNDGSNGGRGYK